MTSEKKETPSDILHWGYEWKTKASVWGLPLIHIAIGRDRKTGKLLIAKGVVAIGQFAIGIISFAQFSLGVVVGFGQFSIGIIAVAQFALGILFGLGQFATGVTAIGQFAFGKYVLAQIGYGEYVWSAIIRNITAFEYFKNLL
ncbi:MAG: hypothetical protein NT079_06290 [Candidatus Omnitrophica bacterium]|nr:hypothetical protein [Candidatus Omnitrophota bacterium]